MNHPEHILRTFDSHLLKPTRLILCGRAALALGFPNAQPQFHATMSHAFHFSPPTFRYPAPQPRRAKISSIQNPKFKIQNLSSSASPLRPLRLCGKPPPIRIDAHSETPQFTRHHSRLFAPIRG